MAPTFQLHARLGRGGMGEVFLATMDEGGVTQTVALKRMRVEVAETAAGLQQFEREAKICALLSHENVVALRAFGKDAKGPYLALEYVEGRSASQLLRAYEALGDVLPPGAVWQLALDVALGLESAHRVGTVHRDLSPDNVLVSFSGISKVGDFGIAKLAGGTSFTTTGTVKGKYGYMAPELFDGHEADASSDRFALAATLYQLWCGVTPFRGKTEAEMLRSVLSAEPAPMGQLRAGAPGVVVEWIHGTLAKERAARPASLEKLIAALREAAGGRDAVAACMTRAFPNRELPVTPEEELERRGTKPVMVPMRRRAVWPFVLAGFALVLGAAAVPVVMLVKAGPPPVPPPFLGVVPPPPPVPASPAPEPEPVVEREPEPEPVAKPATKGSLRVKVKPWGRVFVDGRLLGVTPLAPVTLSPGKHQVIVVNEQLKAQKQFSVDVRAGKTEELKVVLGE